LRYLVLRACDHYRRDGAVAFVRRVLRWGVRTLARRLDDKPLGYRLWVRLYDRLSRNDRLAIARHIDRMQDRPVLSLLVALDDAGPDDLRRTIRSVVKQIYPDWELCIAGEAVADPRIAKILAGVAVKDARIKIAPRTVSRTAADNAALALAAGDFVALVDVGDALAPQALYIAAAAIDAHPTADILYSDEDRIAGAFGSRRPFFKPDWNPDLFTGQNYIGRLCLMRRRLVVAAGGVRPGFDGCGDYDLLLRIIEGVAPDHIHHLPFALYHGRTERPVSAAAAQRAVAEHCRRKGLGVAVDIVPTDLSGYLRLRYPLPDPPPRVSVIIPTRDGLDLLRQCIDGLLTETDYPDLEIIIVDNGSDQPATLAYLQAIDGGPVRVLRDDGPFNYSALNNKAVAAATGTVVALLNNDTKVIHRDWLQEMVSQACRPEVGAVGAKLHFPDDSLQHAGVVIGLGGVAGHLHLGLPGGAAGYHDDVHLVRDVSCVTAACLVLRKAVFEEAGGLDALRLPVAFNDVDLCLKIRALGYRILWTPFARLYHFESASRGSDYAPDKIARFRREQATMKALWGATLDGDPYYNPNRTQHGCSGALAFPPRVEKPWRTDEA
jgi:GT2 family glycosyltransferase